MDQASAKEQRAKLREDLTETYHQLGFVLSCLPVPVLYIMDPGDPATVNLVVPGLHRASVLLEWQPGLTGQARGHVRAAIIAWITAYEIFQLTSEHGITPWRLESIAASLAHFRAAARRVAADLG